MARGRKNAGAKRRKPAKRRKAPQRAQAARRKPAKRGAAKAKSRKQRTKVQSKRAVAKKAAPRKQQREPEIDVIDIETVEEVAPGVALVTDYELVGVREPAAEVPTKGRGKKGVIPGSSGA